MDSKSKIANFYNDWCEDRRLREGEGLLELARTQEIVSRYIGNKKLRILDVGGASGVYSFWLAGLGHEVQLVDLSPKHVDEAKRFNQKSKQQLASIELGDACDLSKPAGYFDIVLLMGPLYHLIEKSDRVAALKEAKRVTKPGGLIFCAAISRFASLTCGFREDMFADDDYVEIVNSDLTEGIHFNHTDKDYFTDAYFHLPEEFQKEIDESGLQCEALLGIEGLTCTIAGFDEKWKDPSFKKLVLKYLRLTESAESLLGVSSHLLAVCRAQ